MTCRCHGDGLASGKLTPSGADSSDSSIAWSWFEQGALCRCQAEREFGGGIVLNPSL